MATVLPAARRPLISMSQIDDGGCYETMAGGSMRLRKGPDQSNFLALPRLDQESTSQYAQDRHRVISTENDVTWELQEGEKSPLYSVPLSLFRIQVRVQRKGGKRHRKTQNKQSKTEDEGDMINLATRYSEKEKLELLHAQLAHRSMF